MESGDKKGRVLIFSSREICYLSANFFANQLGAAFEELGYEADICEFTAEDDLDEKLKPYLGQRYEVIAILIPCCRGWCLRMGRRIWTGWTGRFLIIFWIIRCFIIPGFPPG